VKHSRRTLHLNPAYRTLAKELHMEKHKDHEQQQPKHDEHHEQQQQKPPPHPGQPGHQTPDHSEQPGQHPGGQHQND